MKYVIVFAFVLYTFFFSPSIYAAYQYPWPGILPDHPLYVFKVIRNRLIEKLIYSPVRKVEFDLLMADKTLYAARLLFDKGEWSLARETALKGENYMSILVPDYFEASASGRMIPIALKKRLRQAHAAHQELISDLLMRETQEYRKTYEDVLYFSKKNQEMLESTTSADTQGL